MFPGHAVFHKVAQRVLSAEKHPREVDVQDFPPVLQGHFMRDHPVFHARVIDPDVQAAERVQSRLQERFDALLGAHVRLHGHGLAACRPKGVHHFVRALLVPVVVDHDGNLFLPQPEGNGGAQSF